MKNILKVQDNIEENSQNLLIKESTPEPSISSVHTDFTTIAETSTSIPSIYTVEDTLDEILQRKVVAAGRTDKGVSSLSQIVSFSTFDEEVTVEKLFQQFNDSIEKKNNNICLLDVYRVSRKFHPLFLAKWRRYLYLLPINIGEYKNIYNNEEIFIDVDVNFINFCFNNIEGKTLPYNGFAHRENRATGQGLSDICTLFRAKAYIVKINDVSDILSNESDLNYKSEDEETENNEYIANSDEKNNKDIKYIDSNYTVVIELVGDRFLRRMVRNLVATAVRESVLPIDQRDDEILLKICKTGKRERASLSICGLGLGLCGVGYDGDELYDFENKKNISEKNGNKSQEKNPNSRRNRQENKNEIHLNEKEQERIENENNLNLESDIPLKKIKFEENVKDFNYRLVSNQFIEKNSAEFQHELVAYDPYLLHYPERLFEFQNVNEISNILNQDKKIDCKHLTLVLKNLTHSNVGETVWDAEVILAHFLDHYSPKLLNSYKELQRPLNILELGAGQGLAGMLMSHFVQELKFKGIVLLQELEDIIDNNITSYEFSNFNIIDLLNNSSKSVDKSSVISNIDSVNNFSNPFLAVLRAWWGENCIKDCKDIFSRISKKIIESISPNEGDSKECNNQFADIILLSDVTYNRIYFDDLLNTVSKMLKKDQNISNKFPKYIFLTLEQRRINLNNIIKRICDIVLLSEPTSIIKYNIKQPEMSEYQYEISSEKITQFAMILFEIQ